jgi:TRAP-type C4-dicarboxylate transport system permease small subunit
MADRHDHGARPADPVGRALFRLCVAFVLVGGVLLVACAGLTTLSIVTHAVFNKPISGEFELVSFGTSWAVYFFLPYCQLVKGNVVVDVFMARAGPRLRDVADAVGGLLFFAVIALLLWRMGVGAVEIAGTGQTSAVMKIRYWWSFPPALACLALLAVVTLYTLWQSIRGVRA